jgi:hypothetical protein
MNVRPAQTLRVLSVLSGLLLAGAALAQSAAPAKADPLAGIRTRADLDALLAATASAPLKKALTAESAAILAAAERKPAVERVAATLDQARGTYERINLTPQPLAQALGGPSGLFDSLRVVNLADAGLGVKAKRETDPFDQAFYEDVGRLAGLEDLQIMHTVCQNEWLAPLANLKSLRSLRIINQAKLDDAGLAHLAGLNQLEAFSYIGTKMTGEPFKDFRGWTNLKRSSYRGSRMSDAGLISLCAAFPNLESLVLAHGHFTDEAVAHVAKLSKLTGLEIGSPQATPECLRHIAGLKLEYLQLGDGLDKSAGIAIIKDIGTLKRLTLTGMSAATAADLAAVAGMKHLEHLEMNNLPDERLAELSQFGFLGSLRLVRSRPPFTPEQQAAIQAALPKVAIKFE